MKTTQQPSLGLEDYIQDWKVNRELLFRPLDSKNPHMLDRSLSTSQSARIIDLTEQTSREVPWSTQVVPVHYKQLDWSDAD